GISFAQEADDLFFRKTLLHVQSPRVRELDSKLRCYSKSGGRRFDANNILFANVYLPVEVRNAASGNNVNFEYVHVF
ncbi:hypothetical protein Q6A25_04070, partial [Xanthomonas euvesicatoria pv. eucalypti]|nr:hypothetical protein [Xanthomonas euvesicatoria pv. eucalypti]MDO7959161.1 hypothetical protein [Xanthomonas euvesicatoria pv. eucalypti]